jgi:hypothetical protein
MVSRDSRTVDWQSKEATILSASRSDAAARIVPRGTDAVLREEAGARQDPHVEA